MRPPLCSTRRGSGARRNASRLCWSIGASPSGVRSVSATPPVWRSDGSGGTNPSSTRRAARCYVRSRMRGVSRRTRTHRAGPPPRQVVREHDRVGVGMASGGLPAGRAARTVTKHDTGPAESVRVRSDVVEHRTRQQWRQVTLAAGAVVEKSWRRDSRRGLRPW